MCGGPELGASRWNSRSPGNPMAGRSASWCSSSGARRCPPARWRMIGAGWGAGQRDPQHYPNALRILVAEPATEAGSVTLLACDLDDLSPEYVEPLRQALVAAGALDVETWPVQMKKGRTGFRLEA